jgi:Icc-related predicted phosphoesterase
LIAGLIALALTGCGPERGPDTTITGLDLPTGESILVVGDWGTGTESQQEVAEAMATYAEDREIAAILTTGDNFYSDDAEQIMKPFDWAREREIPFLISLGNHDVESQERVELIEETFADQPAWWAHEWGPIDIVILDSTQVASGRQMEFLLDTTAASDDPTIVVFHHPPLSCGSHGDDEAVGARWVSRFDDDVFLVLSGHEHNYQRFESEGITYVVTGGGGAALTELSACGTNHPPRIAGEDVHHFAALELADTVNVDVIDADGTVIDAFSLALP